VGDAEQHAVELAAALRALLDYPAPAEEPETGDAIYVIRSAEGPRYTEGARPSQADVQRDIGALLRAAEKPVPTEDVRKALRGALGDVLCNAMNFPEKVQSRILGQDMRPLMDATTGAILARFHVTPKSDMLDKTPAPNERKYQ